MKVQKLLEKLNVTNKCLIFLKLFLNITGTDPAPEYYSKKQYSAAPTSVWQVGRVLFDLVRDKGAQFSTGNFLLRKLTWPKWFSEGNAPAVQNNHK